MTTTPPKYNLKVDTVVTTTTVHEYHLTAKDILALMPFEVPASAKTEVYVSDRDIIDIDTSSPLVVRITTTEVTEECQP